jgi:hypothetical protein
MIVLYRSTLLSSDVTVSSEYLLLVIITLQMPEEEAFAVLVKLMQDYKMRDMYKPTMAELGLCMYQLENLVQVQYNSLSVGPSLLSYKMVQHICFKLP